MVCSAEEVEATVAMLRRKDAMAYTTVVAATKDASLGERYAAVSSACSLGERVRDQGGHALVIIDDLACMVGYPLWPLMQEVLLPGHQDLGLLV